eukprot:TRINITY_DN16415_c0_g1_i1.p1 TRINITY_DN16415_c0_g1~~TRINITY_DN16415_c0_g1_i1.p1  ORF type:complete len:207 (+),score=31.48 TRINITY_DN16415_c0_g1_i1:51-671(+)
MRRFKLRRKNQTPENEVVHFNKLSPRFCACVVQKKKRSYEENNHHRKGFSSRIHVSNEGLNLEKSERMRKTKSLRKLDSHKKNAIKENCPARKNSGDSEELNRLQKNQSRSKSSRELRRDGSADKLREMSALGGTRKLREFSEVRHKKRRKKSSRKRLYAPSEIRDAIADYERKTKPQIFSRRRSFTGAIEIVLGSKGCGSVLGIP